MLLPGLNSEQDQYLKASKKPFSIPVLLASDGFDGNFLINTFTGDIQYKYKIDP